MDREEPAATWPAPLRVGPVPATSRPRRGTGRPLPIDPGRWGRPPGAPRRPLPPWVPVGAPPPPPLPPVPAPSAPITEGASRLRRRSILIEALVAVAILVTVALAGAGGRSTSTSAPVASSRLTDWARQSIPIITNLVADLTAIGQDTAPGTSPSSASINVDAAGLRRDLAAANALAAPPDGATASRWLATLGQIARAQTALDAVSAPTDPLAIARVQRQAATAGDDLFSTAQALPH
jgi:hypothetical protein